MISFCKPTVNPIFRAHEERRFLLDGAGRMWYKKSCHEGVTGDGTQKTGHHGWAEYPAHPGLLEIVRLMYAGRAIREIGLHHTV